MTKSRFTLALTAAAMTAGLSACADNGVREEVVMSRWIKRDTTMASLVHVYKWKGEGGRLFTDVRTSEIVSSRLELRAVDIAWSDDTHYFTGHRTLLVFHHAVPCPDMLFTDTILFFSYLPRDQAKPRTCYENGATPGAPNPERRLMAGIPDGGGFGELAGQLDTSALLQELTNEGLYPDEFAPQNRHQVCPSGNWPCESSEN